MMLNASKNAEKALAHLKMDLYPEEDICCPKCEKRLVGEVTADSHRKGCLFYCKDCIRDHDTYILTFYVTIVFFALGYLL